jgi:hypothetical protein
VPPNPVLRRNRPCHSPQPKRTSSTLISPTSCCLCLPPRCGWCWSSVIRAASGTHWTTAHSSRVGVRRDRRGCQGGLAGGPGTMGGHARGMRRIGREGSGQAGMGGALMQLRCRQSALQPWKASPPAWACSWLIARDGKRSPVRRHGWQPPRPPFKDHFLLACSPMDTNPDVTVTSPAPTSPHRPIRPPPHPHPPRRLQWAA